MWLLTSLALSVAAAQPLSLPAGRGGQDLVGSALPDLHFDRWLGPEPRTVGRVTLYRWWTDACPYCEASLPAIERLRERYAPQGLTVVAAYHPKPVRAVDDALVSAAAKRVGYKGPIAVDASWSQLERLYLSTGSREATSITVLVDRRGVVRFLHPGPDLFPSARPEAARQNSDYELLERAVTALLAER